MALLIYNYASSTKHNKPIAIDLSKCVIDCDCGCMAKKEEVKKETPKPKKVIEKKLQKRVVKKKVEKKAVVKKEPVKKVSQPKVKKVVMTKEVLDEPKPEPVETSVEEEVQQDEPPLTQQEPSEQDVVQEELRKSSAAQKYVNDHLSEIIRMLKQNLYYPDNARKRRLQGDVVVKFTLLKNRDIKDVIITKHSHDILDASAVKTIENLQGRLPAPVDDMVLEVPINYRLH